MLTFEMKININRLATKMQQNGAPYNYISHDNGVVHGKSVSSSIVSSMTVRWATSIIC
jgi:hypothetical protein